GEVMTPSGHDRTLARAALPKSAAPIALYLGMKNPGTRSRRVPGPEILGLLEPGESPATGRSGLEVHPAHAAYATHAAHAAAAMRMTARRRLGLRLLGDHRLGSDQQAGDRGRILQRDAHDLGRIDDAGLDHV